MKLAIGNQVRRLLRYTLAGGFIVTLIVAALAQTPLYAEDATEELPPRTVKMTVENFKWVPKQIRVPRGTKLILQIRSYDATHRFDLKKPYNLKVLLPQEKTTTVEFVASHVGTFRWKCGRPCGNGCPKMTGKLIVYDPAEVAGAEAD